MPGKIAFIGTGWRFPPRFHKVSGKTEMVSDEQDIGESLQILLSTSLGERIMQPTYGCRLKELLFEPLDLTLKTYIKNLIETAILYHEPRITLNDLLLREIPTEGILEMTLVYTIRGTNSRYNFVYPFYLNEGTNIDS